MKQTRTDRILSLLEETGEWRSGEDIAALLGITRAAVGRHIILLRARGHIVAARQRRGYRLEIKADALSEENVRPLLRSKTLGHTAWRCFTEVDSTNREAVRWALEGAQDGNVVLAERQREGRGRLGRSWFSAPRAVHCSVVLCRFIAEDRLPLFLLPTLAAAEAIVQCTDLPAKIKAPNDVYVAGRKVCGTLVELGLRGMEIEWAVVGIGCNINTLIEEFPEKLRAVAGSLLSESGRVVNRNVFLAAVLERLEFWRERADIGCEAELRNRWNALSA